MDFVKGFCYLRDILDVDGGTDPTATAINRN